MDFTNDQLLEVQGHLSDYDSRYTAPMVLWGGLVLLQGSESVVAALTQGQMAESTTWRSIWVTDTRVVYAEATKAHGQWSAYADWEGAETADSLETWARPLTDVSTLRLTGQEIYKERQYSSTHKWNTGAEVEFRDGLRIPIPLFGEAPGYEARPKVEALIQALSDRLWR